LIIAVADAKVEPGPSELDLNQLPWWLAEPIAPQQSGVSAIYTLRVVGTPGCVTGNWASAGQAKAKAQASRRRHRSIRDRSAARLRR
jgi:hypothetical protein